MVILLQQAKKFPLILTILLTNLPLIFPDQSQGIPVKNAYINFAGAGGNWTARNGTFRVSDPTTLTPVQGGLILYDIHLAKMIELTQYWCQQLPEKNPDYTVHWNYEAVDGRVFMGDFSFTCRFADQLFEKIGKSTPETLTIHHRGNPTTITLDSLNLTDNPQAFIDVVKTLTPRCIETTPPICPGQKWK